MEPQSASTERPSKRSDAPSEKAKDFAHLFGHEGFNPLKSVDSAFKDRHGISCRVTSSENGEVGDAFIQAWFDVILETLL